MFAFTKKQRALNEIERRRGQAATYTEKLPREADDLKDFLADFYRNIIFKRQAEMKEELLKYPKTVGRLYNELVVDTNVIQYEDFWQRYYYRTANIDRVMAELDAADAVARLAREKALKDTWSSVTTTLASATTAAASVTTASASATTAASSTSSAAENTGAQSNSANTPTKQPANPINLIPQRTIATMPTTPFESVPSSSSTKSNAMNTAAATTTPQKSTTALLASQTPSRSASAASAAYATSAANTVTSFWSSSSAPPPPSPGSLVNQAIGESTLGGSNSSSSVSVPLSNGKQPVVAATASTAAATAVAASADGANNDTTLPALDLVTCPKTTNLDVVSAEEVVAAAATALMDVSTNTASSAMPFDEKHAKITEVAAAVTTVKQPSSSSSLLPKQQPQQQSNRSTLLLDNVVADTLPSSVVGSATKDVTKSIGSVSAAAAVIGNAVPLSKPSAPSVTTTMEMTDSVAAQSTDASGTRGSKIWPGANAVNSASVSASISAPMKSATGTTTVTTTATKNATAVTNEVAAKSVASSSSQSDKAIIISRSSTATGNVVSTLSTDSHNKTTTMAVVPPPAAESGPGSQVGLGSFFKSVSGRLVTTATKSDVNATASSDNVLADATATKLDGDTLAIQKGKASNSSAPATTMQERKSVSTAKVVDTAEAATAAASITELPKSGMFRRAAAAAAAAPKPASSIAPTRPPAIQPQPNVTSKDEMSVSATATTVTTDAASHSTSTSANNGGGGLGGLFKTLRKVPKSNEGNGSSSNGKTAVPSTGDVLVDWKHSKERSLAAPSTLPSKQPEPQPSSKTNSTARAGMWQRVRGRKVSQSTAAYASDGGDTAATAAEAEVESKSRSATPVTSNKVRFAPDTDAKGHESAASSSQHRRRQKFWTGPFGSLVAAFLVAALAVCIRHTLAQNPSWLVSAVDGLCTPILPGRVIDATTMALYNSKHGSDKQDQSSTTRRWEAPWWVPVDSWKPWVFANVCRRGRRRMRTIVELTLHNAKNPKASARLDVFHPNDDENGTSRHGAIVNRKRIQSIQCNADGSLVATTVDGKEETIAAVWNAL